MELMSSLLLYALAAVLLQALEVTSISRQSDYIIIMKPNMTAHKQKLINMNALPLVNSATDIQSVFKDVNCRECINCMERVMKAHFKQSKYNMLHRKPDIDELYYEVLHEIHPINKRSTNLTKIEGKSKPKRHGIKKNKSVAITKYFDETGKVFALKVKELSSKNSTNDKKFTCKVYSVSQSLACDKLDETIDAPTRKVKRDRKSKHKTSSSTSATTATTTFKKHEVYNVEVSESYMPSLEDMY